MSVYDGSNPQDNGFMPSEIDPTGSSLDPSFYYAASPGGRFPGDIWSFLESLAAQDPSAARNDGSHTANPDYSRASWEGKVPGKVGKIVDWISKFHEWNVRNNSDGRVTNPLAAGDPYMGMSGTAAAYGPAGGPLHGLLDQGRPDMLDGSVPRGVPDYPGEPTSAGGGKKHHGGGSNFGPLNFVPYGGAQPGHQSSFVDWQPKQPFTVDDSPTKFVHGGGASAGAPAVPAPKAGKPGKHGKPPMAAGGAGTGGAGAGGRGAGGATAGGGGADLTSTLRQMFPDATDAEIQQALAYYNSDAGAPSSNLGDSGLLAAGRGAVSPNMQHLLGRDHDYVAGAGTGYDTGYLDKGTPGWVRDPTTRIVNTAGMPLSTPLARSNFSNTDDYIAALHGQGYDNESIMGLLNSWGTGDVVRGPDGSYQFANDPRANAQAPRGYGGTGNFTIGADGQPMFAGAGGGAGGGVSVNGGPGGMNDPGGVWSNLFRY